MKFSVIIPLYNKAPYIRKALESVIAQTYTDYELIIVDDGSSDDSLAIAKRFITDRFAGDSCTVDRPAGCSSATPVVMVSQANQGVSAARNNGAAHAKGDYLAFLDADDWWEPTYLERMAQLIADYPDAGLYACNYIYYKPGKTHVALDIPTGYINYPKAYYESGAMPVTSITAVIPKIVFEQIGGFPVGIKLGEDFLVWAQIALQYPVAFLNEPLAYYNNDVPATLRATRNLHKPEEHMLFRMEEFIGESLKVKGNENGEAEKLTYTQSPIANSPALTDWSRLLDKLRVNGLLDYWLCSEYHDAAVAELQKVDWTKQPASVKRIYKTPIWILKLKRMVMRIGSFVKQRILKAMRRRR